jgi:hypothetical protein
VLNCYEQQRAGRRDIQRTVIHPACVTAPAGTTAL